ncbi:MAG: hypothetical protein IJU45_00875 [Clostridia bacterium]|nr:hypothetical protein [Clostridia bacterium]
MKFREFIIVFLLGGTVYALVEILFRGFTHWTMLLAGGFIFYMLYVIFNHIGKGHILLKCILGCAFITSAEYLAGALLNIVLEMNIWDYSAKPLNLYGQICPAYSLGWFFLSLPACALSDAICKRLR